MLPGAFDNGWFAIADDYVIRVRERPELAGYDELRQFDGTRLDVPADDDLRPSLRFLRERNRLHERD